MTRIAALGASTIFVALALVCEALSVGSQAAVASALFLISGSMCGLMLLLAAGPHAAPVPVRVRRVPH